MKKLIVLAAAVMVAAVSQAAAVGWSCAGANAYANGSYSVFVVGMNGVESASQIAAIVAAGDLSSAKDYAFYTDGSISNTGVANVLAASSGKSLTYTEGGTAADNTYYGFIIVQDKDATIASYTDVKSVTLANNSTSKTFSFSNQSTALGANKFELSSVPEPTSGLLLLLGMAGLALKRKRA